MKIFISEADRQSAKRIALKNIGRFYNLPDWEFKTNEELYLEISNLSNSSSNSIYTLLNEYFKAYDAWFAFYQRRKRNQTETNYNLNNEEQQELNDLIEKRQGTLDALQEKFDELQLI